MNDVAYAKINLALHVRRRRDDGYHDLETLFAFLDDGDRLTAHAADRFGLTEQGRFGASMGCPDDNLITKAALLAGRGVLPPVMIDIDKRLPVAAGLGGGSADAAATLRLLGAGDRLDLAAALGADVPACLASVPVIGRGTGTALAAVDNDVTGLACILVNPLMRLSTGPVFAGWEGVDRGPLPVGSAREIMLSGRNDLEAPAIALCPAVSHVLEVLAATGPMVARMSGSGASCFAVYDDYALAKTHERRILERHPDWWTMTGRLR